MHKEKGGAHLLFLSFVFIATLVLLFRFHYQKNLIRYVYEYVDEGLTVSLMACGIINMEEYGRSRQIVIHDNLPDSLFKETDNEGEEEDLSDTDTGEVETEPVTIPVTAVPGIEKADNAVKHSYQIFEGALKTNLNLDRSFTSKNPIIISNIEIKKYIVYNVFRNIDTEYRYTGESRICRYEYSNGNWNSGMLGSAGSAGIETTSLVDKGYLVIQNTSVFAEIAFDIQIMPYSRFYFPESMGEGDSMGRVSYSRAVDITVEL